MNVFQPGEIVDITIKGARVVEVCRHGDGNGDDLRFIYEAKDGDQWPSAVWVNAPGVAVERVAPAEWPPQIGDVWRSEAEPFFAATPGDVDDDDRELQFVNVGGEFLDPGFVLTTWGPLTLMHREDDEQDGGA